MINQILDFIFIFYLFIFIENKNLPATTLPLWIPILIFSLYPGLCGTSKVTN